MIDQDPQQFLKNYLSLPPDSRTSVAQDEHGYWHMLGASGSPRLPVRQTARTYPWVYMVGANGQRWLWAGGSLTDKAPTVHLVRLISKDGQVIEDTSQA